MIREEGCTCVWLDGEEIKGWYVGGCPLHDRRVRRLAETLEELMRAARHHLAESTPENQASLAAGVTEATRLLHEPSERLNTLEDLWAKADAGPKPESVMPLDPFKEESKEWLDGGARVVGEILAVLELGQREVEAGLVEPAETVFQRLKHPGPLPEPIKLEGEGPTASDPVLQGRQGQPLDRFAGRRPMKGDLVLAMARLLEVPVQVLLPSLDLVERTLGPPEVLNEIRSYLGLPISAGRGRDDPAKFPPFAEVVEKTQRRV